MDSRSESIALDVEDERQLGDRRAESRAHHDDTSARRVRLDVCFEVLSQVDHVATIHDPRRIPKTEANRSQRQHHRRQPTPIP